MLTSRLFDSFAAVPADWYELCDSSDVAMDPRVLDVFQRTLAGQCRCWGLIVYNESEAPVACAALCMFPTELMETSQPTLVAMRDGMRRKWPGFLRMNVLFCGLPVPSGATHVRLRDETDAPAVLAEIHRVMRLLARDTKSRLTIFKELHEAQGLLAKSLLNMGYLQGGIPPMHEIHGAFKDFATYRDALKSRYRAQVLRSQKKLETAGFEVFTGRGSAFFEKHFNLEVYALYVAVQQRAEQKLELMTPEFFRELALALEDEVFLTFIRREGRVCAFTFAIKRGATHYNMYSGLDYALNNEGDLYFNLFYNDMDQAFRAGATSLHLGQTSDSFKSRLGSSTQKLWFFAHAPAPWFHALLRQFSSLAFPKVAEVEAHEVFSTPPAPPKTGKKNARAKV